MDARASDFYIKEKIAGPERYAHTRHREMEELRKENNRLFGRLLSIYEVSVWLLVGTHTLTMSAVLEPFV